MTGRRRDVRRFGRGPYVLGLRRDLSRWGSGFPYDVPAVAAVDSLSLDAPVTLLAGDNGTGKSTIVEAIAEAIGFAAQGGELERSGELPAVPRRVFGEALEPMTFAPDLSLYGDVPLHQQSHGQSFLALAANRFAGESIYVLDEPEAALSVSGALALVAVVVRAAEAGAQFVIATHSPVLLAIPGARIYELGESGIATCDYDDLDTVRLMRGFLDAPERFLRAALGE